ncbi:MAG TPA: hypothetical protein VK575_02370 [Gemmatimonadaceae bacterium]|nr:hypothetical protein [Gemmatimonadaceae bacterium]
MLVKIVSRLCLHDELVVHDHVESLLSQEVVFVEYSYCDLTGNAMFAGEKLPFESHYINVLKESKTKSIVHVKERPNDRLREAFLKEVAARHVLMMAR